MKTVTIPAMIRGLESTGNKGAKIAVIKTETRPKMIPFSVDGRPNPYPDGVTRIAYRSVTLGVNYEAAVNRQRLNEGNLDYFHADKLWKGAGARHGVYTVTHKPTGKLYFAYRPSQKWPEGVPTVLEDEWRYKGRFISKPTEWLKPPGKARKQAVDKPVPWRTLDLENLLELRYGEDYEIDHTIPALVAFV